MRVQNVLKSAAQTQKQINLVKLHEQSKASLEQEIQNYKEEATKQRKIIYQLEKDRDRYINEASDLTQKVSWSLTSPFSTNMAIAMKKVRGGELSLPSEGRPAIY